MFSGSVIVIAILMVLQAQSSTTTTTISFNSISGSTSASSSSENPSATISPVTSTGSSTDPSTDPSIAGSSTATHPAITGSSTSTNPSTVSSTAATATTINPTATSQQIASTTPVSSSSTPVHTTEKPTTKPPSEKTCGNISVELKTPWNESYTNISSHFHADLRTLLTGVFSDSSKYSDVNVSVLILIQKGEGVILNATLCVVVKSDDAGFIDEDKIAKDGKIGNIEVVKGSLNFTAIVDQTLFCRGRVSDFKAKDEECDKCSGGGAGPIVIEGNCKPTTHSCNGVKPATKETDDCVTYCDSSAVAMRGISTLIFGMGVLLSASLIIWE